MTPATKTDWQTQELLSSHRIIRLNRTFSSQEIQRIQLGLVPEQMEDKWFIYWQNNTLYFHRSWTKFCIYVVRFKLVGDSYLMFEADLNRDADQYRETSDSRDAAMISYLIDALLLQQKGNFPSESADSEEATLMKWSQVGRAMLGQHPKYDEVAEPSGEPKPPITRNLKS